MSENQTYQNRVVFECIFTRRYKYFSIRPSAFDKVKMLFLSKIDLLLYHFRLSNEKDERLPIFKVQLTIEGNMM